MDFRSLIQSLDTITEGEKVATKTGTIHKGHYGQADLDDDGKQVKKPEQVKKGRGRPTKASKDEHGSDIKHDTSGIQSMLGGKPTGKVGKVSAKHKLKDWIEIVDKNALNEDGVTIKPMPGASQIIGANGKPIGTADMQTANLIKQASEKGTLSLGTDDQQGMAETAPDSNNRQWSKKDMERLRVATKDFDDIMASDGPEATKQNLIKKRIQTKPITGPKGVLPEQSVDDMPAHALDRMNQPNKKFYTNNPNAMRADRERVSTGANTLSDKGHKRAGGAYKVRPSDPNKGKVTRLSSSFKNIKESVLNDSFGDTFNHILNTYKRDVNDFKTTGELSSHLYDVLYDYYFDDMPYGTKKARDGDPYEWIGDRFASDIGLEEAVRPENIPAMQRKQQGSNFPVTMKQVQDTSDKISHADTLKSRFNQPSTTKNPFAFEDAQVQSWDKQLNTLLTEGITVTSSTGQQGAPDSVSINATDADAQELTAILKQAGLGVFGGDQSAQPEQGMSMMSKPEGHGSTPETSPEVVGDGDDMLSLIKKMSGIQGGQPSANPEGTADADYEEEESGEEEVSEGWDAKQAVNDCAKDYMQSSGISSVHNLDAEAIEHIGNECQINYEEVCKILGCELPAGLGPVDADDEENMDIDINKHGIDPEGDYGQDEVEEGNAFSGAVAKAKSDNIPDKGQKFKVGNKEYPVKEESEEGAEEEHEHGHEEMCNECGYTMESCECPHEEEQVEESYSNSNDDQAMQDLHYMLQTLSGGANGPKRSQATGNITKVTAETKLFKDSGNLLTDWKKLSGIK
jgi:hypothetical protein